MKKMIKTLSTLALAGGVMFLSSCNKDSDDNNNDPNVTQKNTTIKGTLESESQFSLMNEAVELSGQGNVFAEASSNHTLFAANNAAFQQVFADLGINSMVELKAQMGAEAFGKMVMYHAIKGKYAVADFSSGFMNSLAADGGSEFSLYVENQNNSRLIINGDDANGAATVSSTSFGATNGSVIEIDGVLNAQSNYENLLETHDSESMMVKVINESDASIKALLETTTDKSTLLVMSNSQVEGLLSMNLGDILDNDDLENLLDATQKADLFTQFSVTTITDLRAKIKLSDLAAHGITTADVYAELDQADKTELAGSFIFMGNYKVSDFTNGANLNTKLGSNLTVSSDNAGNIVLSNSNGAKIIFGADPVGGTNGSNYAVNEVSVD